MAVMTQAKEAVSAESKRTPVVLLVDDDETLRHLIADFLEKHGMEVFPAADGPGADAILAKHPVDVVVLDVMLPGEDGLSICRRLTSREDARPAVIMLSAAGEDTDRIVGLELGADDYLPKPFNPRELLARLRAILRRRSPAGGKREEILRFGRLEIDRGARLVRVSGEERPLTSYQFDLLWALATHAGRVMSREALMDKLRGEEFEAFDRSLDVQISRLRAVIEEDPKHPRRIITVRGAGYVFSKNQDT